MDNFPSLVIYLSLLAVATDASLWEFHDEDNLIFTRKDYADPENSGAVRTAEAVSRPGGRDAVRASGGVLRASAGGRPRFGDGAAGCSTQYGDPASHGLFLNSGSPCAAPASSHCWRLIQTDAWSGPINTCSACFHGFYRAINQSAGPNSCAPGPPDCSYCPHKGHPGPAGGRGGEGGRGAEAQRRDRGADEGSAGSRRHGSDGCRRNCRYRAAISALANSDDEGVGASGGSELSGSGGASGGSEPSGGGNGVVGPSSQAPAIAGGETPPTVTLELSSSTISENGGSSTVTASLNSPSSAMTTLTVSIAPGPGAVSADYTLSKAALTIEAGSTTSADSLTVSAIDNATDAPDKTVSIYGGASNELGAIDPAAVTLTIVDDDAAPAVALELDSFSISESGGAANVTASLSGPSSQDVTLVVSASSEPPADDGHFTITPNNTLTIPAGSTVSAGTVTITAIDNSVDEPDKSVTVSATIAGNRGVTLPSSWTLTITDDDATPTVTLSLSSSSISEDGGVSMVTRHSQRPLLAACDPRGLRVSGVARREWGLCPSAPTIPLP